MAIATMLMLTSNSVYAQSEYIDELDVGFDWLTKSCQESYLVTEDGTFKRLDCTYLEAITGDVIISKGGDFIRDIIIEEDADTETKITDAATTVSKPVIRTEQQEKMDGIRKAQAIVEAYGKGELDVQEYCFGRDGKSGTIYEKEGTIEEEHETIDVARPYDNQPLKTNQELKYKQLMSNICEAEYKMKYKVHNWLRTLPGEGEAYIFVPRDNFEGIELWQNTTGLDNPQYAYDEAKMTGFNLEKSRQVAEGFQCSTLGKVIGHCPTKHADIDEPQPKDYMSKEGKANLAEWEAYLKTGETALPFQDRDAGLDPFAVTKQYLSALGYNSEQIEAAIAALSEEK